MLLKCILKCIKTLHALVWLVSLLMSPCALQYILYITENIYKNRHDGVFSNLLDSY